MADITLQIRTTTIRYRTAVVHYGRTERPVGEDDVSLTCEFDPPGVERSEFGGVDAAVSVQPGDGLSVFDARLNRAVNGEYFPFSPMFNHITMHRACATRDSPGLIAGSGLKLTRRLAMSKTIPATLVLAPITRIKPRTRHARRSIRQCLQ